MPLAIFKIFLLNVRSRKLTAALRTSTNLHPSLIVSLAAVVALVFVAVRSDGSSGEEEGVALKKSVSYSTSTTGKF